MRIISLSLHYCCSDSASYKGLAVILNKSSSPSPHKGKGPESAPPRITSNVKQNLQFLKLWKEFQKSKSSAPKPATSYRRKKVQKEELPEDIELYRDPTTTLYYTNQGLDDAVPVLLVDGYNVCGYWMKLKKHFMKGRLDIARQKLIDELITFRVKVVVVFDAMMSGLPTHKETFAGIDIVYSGESCADAWIEKEGIVPVMHSALGDSISYASRLVCPVVALREDGCPKVWVVTSDHCQQHAAHGANTQYLMSHTTSTMAVWQIILGKGAFIWSSKALVSEVRHFF
ncbi:hypothetical protein GOBAR_AA02831 [Gossypium barbadense]|uniref:NYN domain-containing protein n=1 Tax=Gossypium barbadense TaxID=3634 RepID=A0A2P5YQ82_GOSBA|nr:hypothetical protein GOBAR_AA02831 [Gossypium barbadense]